MPWVVGLVDYVWRVWPVSQADPRWPSWATREEAVAEVRRMRHKNVELHQQRVRDALEGLQQAVATLSLKVPVDVGLGSDGRTEYDP